MAKSDITERRRLEGAIEWRGRDTYRIRVSNGLDPITGRRRWLHATGKGNRRAAERALRKLLGARDDGTATEPSRVTLGEWLTGWISAHAAEGHVGDRAKDRYELIINKHLLPALGAIRLQQLRADQINDLKMRWLSGEDSTAAKPLAGSTVHKHLVVLRRALDDALKAGLISRNPMDAVSAPSVKATSERRALDADEITALFNAAQATRYSVPIRFTVATGIREGELLGLRWDDFDSDARTITIQRTLIYVVGEVRIKPSPKTARSRRTIELSEVTAEMLRSHRAEQARRRLRTVSARPEDRQADAFASAWQEHGMIFPSLIGTPWIPRAFYRGYRGIVDASGIATPETVYFHTLRHTAASQWIRHGVDVFTVSRRLGHASAAFTMDVYGHMLTGQQRKAAEALDYLIAGH